MEPSSVDHYATDTYVWLADDTTQPESDCNANRFVGQTQTNCRYWWRIQPIAGVWCSDGLKPGRVSRRVASCLWMCVGALCHRCVSCSLNVSDSVECFSVGRQSLPNCQRKWYHRVLCVSQGFRMNCVLEWERGWVEVRTAEGASMHALLTPNPPIWTGRDACVHWESLSSTLRILDNPRRSTSLNADKSGLPAHGDVLSMYWSFGMANAFFSKHKTSCACSSERRSTDRSRSLIFDCRAASTAFLSRIGASRRVMSSFAIRLKSLNTGYWSTSSKLLAMISHWCKFRRRPVCWCESIMCWTSLATYENLLSKLMSSTNPSLVLDVLDS